jgi:uncharacterized protein YbcI
MPLSMTCRSPFTLFSTHAAPAVACEPDHHTARRVAQAVGGFEHLLLGRAPRGVVVVIKDESMIVTVLEQFSAMERRLARIDEGRHRVYEFHQSVFDTTLDSLRDHVRSSTGIELRNAIVHVDPVVGSIVKTFTTDTDINLFLLGDGLPAFGVPVDAHLHVPGSDGNGPVRR